MRDLYRQQQRLGLVETIATASNLSDTPEAAFGMALDAICDFTGWSSGHVYMFADDAPDGDLVWSGVWRGEDQFAAFREASARMSFARGVGLPGRVWESGRACWVEDIERDLNFPRVRVALDSGLRAAFAFPALIGEEVGAVLEFFLHHPAPPDEELLRTLDQIGGQLGRVVERYRNARRAAVDHERLEALYAEAQTQRVAAEQASRAKSAFLAVTSHEVRTPLNAVLGLAEALRREPLTPAQHELNDGVLASGAMLLRLLNAVLDMSRIEADQATAQIEAFDLEAKLRSITSIWTPRAAETGVTLAFRLEGANGPTAIRSDVGRLEQTLVNLISNGIKFTPSGGRVCVRAVLSEERLRLEVLDDGPGVPDDARERIFKPFEQTEIGRDAGGAGLGLAICSGNIRLLGGDIGVDCDPSDRNRFWLECPVEVVAHETPEDALEATGRETVGLRVLAAEDNPANRRVLQVLLAPAGVEMRFAEDGVEAVEAALSQPFDLVLMDANMPRMDGVEALRRIRASGGAVAATPVFMLTANAFAEDVERYLAAGADGVLTKPIQLPELFAVLADCGDRATAAQRDAA
ncbi:response regulator [Brevundimonas sp. Root1279]|uniref:response regulator n=1 Tax=Brevundimonas sp. Root1279 TaxID=1736443 RepID=UPI0006F2EF27|nr:response regulator [Brevundimonas sp. Root1279]KQW82206.1 hypothetical protein ASC65_07960 [Brevundimonas sp. Root1279]